ncbi:MAG TPA: tudor domain-containing protein [Spirochaetota bacterium]|nr:hypothetical protein [Spirochaetota bacterium]HOK00887.1 tudor domain-containing protein [Spirochaetota bacterium]HOK91223.1 tudor domain-containing protein [Spirochaetota bacterium]HON15927.1 tudor domain-containing protein [Spirochaetota bacterium]HOV08635.1 tudor domain-containing protein [Spirochaetota bacterium]
MKLLKIVFPVFLIFAIIALDSGDKIRGLGMWSDGYWYPAIFIPEGNNYKAYFDDGDFAILDSSRIKALYWKVGTKVECNWLGRGIYYPGKITSMDGDRIHIFYDDGDEENTVVGRCRSK